MIKDVVITNLNIINTPGGNVKHAMKKSDNGFEGFGEAYFSHINKRIGIPIIYFFTFARGIIEAPFHEVFFFAMWDFDKFIGWGFELSKFPSIKKIYII